MMDSVFQALADASRRTLLDRLFEKNGQTVTELSAGLKMTRQAVSRHLTSLEQANLVVVVWHGREKLHYLNPVPIAEIYNRWIGKFERRQMDAITNVKNKLEENRDE